jgi:hypothetical protein
MPRPVTEISTSAHVHEARLLAVMLRTSRLTWVFGEPGVDKSALLKTGVLPLLQRRCIDRGAAPTDAAGKFAMPDRRRTSVARQTQPRIEAAIYFDSWGDAPLTLLKRRIAQIVPSAAQQAPLVDARLADLLQRLNQQCGVHVIFLLDRFESYLAMAPEAGEVAQFASELVEVVLHQDLPASFLVAMDEAARSRLERFRQRMPGFDQNFLRMSALPHLHDAAAQSASAAALDSAAWAVAASIEVPSPAQPAATEVDKLRRTPVPGAPIKVEDIYAFIEATLAKTTIQSLVKPGQAAAYVPATPASAPPWRHGVTGKALVTGGTLAELDDSTDEDSFFSHARDTQRRTVRNKPLQRRGLATTLAWLKKRQ